MNIYFKNVKNFKNTICKYKYMSIITYKYGYLYKALLSSYMFLWFFFIPGNLKYENLTS